MESISETRFDVVIAGTGLAQSLLALALSRENKKTLHIDKNQYYGGAEAALSLQDAEDWVQAIKQGSLRFSDAEIATSSNSKLGFSRSYSLALAPQIVYSKSAFLPTLVSSKVYRQLEFLAVGAWWTYQADDTGSGQLKKIPSSREDVFADKSIDLKSKRALMKFLKLVTDIDAYGQALETWGKKSLEEFLTQEYNIPTDLQSTLHALTLSPQPVGKTTTLYALPRILRHLSSIGVFGPGFGAVIPKWGGLAEITQVGCRACAVGGGIYMLGKGLAEDAPSTTNNETTVKLQDAQNVKTQWIAGDQDNLGTNKTLEATDLTRSIIIVDSTLPSLFPTIADGAPPAACSIVVFPPGSLSHQDTKSTLPIYLIVHNSETGECPSGQSVIYGSIALQANEGKLWLDQAIAALLSAARSSDAAPIEVLWSLSYAQTASTRTIGEEDHLSITDSMIKFSEPSTDLAFDDGVLREVRQAWQQITGKTNGFMEFEDREVGEYDEDEI